MLVRTRHEGLARALPQHARAEAAAFLCTLALGAQLLVAAFLAPTMFGFWFPPRHLLGRAAARGAARGLGHAPLPAHGRRRWR